MQKMALKLLVLPFGETCSDCLMDSRFKDKFWSWKELSPNYVCNPLNLPDVFSGIRQEMHFHHP